MVDLQIQQSDIGLVVRFLRERWSDRLGRHYSDTDLIVVVSNAFEQALIADYEIYRRLDEREQIQFLETLRTSIYSGQLLSEADLQQHAVVAGAAPQLGLF